MNYMLLQKLQNLFRPNARRGASLLEGIAYLGIAAIIVLKAVSLLTNAFSSLKTNLASEEIISLRTTVKKLYLGQAVSYSPTTSTADLTTSLIAAKAFPITLTPNATGTALTNDWNGAVTVTGTNNGATFTLTYNAVPHDACVNLVNGASGWAQIDQAGNNAITTFPATLADAEAVCSITTSEGNAISFTTM
jgi:hypothetical protein